MNSLHNAMISRSNHVVYYQREGGQYFTCKAFWFRFISLMGQIPPFALDIGFLIDGLPTYLIALSRGFNIPTYVITFSHSSVPST